MPADTPPPVELANLIDALGRRVTLVPTRQGTAAIFTATAETGLDGGHPDLSAENARELGLALVAFADREAES